MTNFHFTYETYNSCLHIQDRRTDPNIRQVPTVDAQQDWNLIAGRQEDGFTILEFSRALDTGDTTGDLVIGEVYSLHH